MGIENTVNPGVTGPVQPQDNPAPGMAAPTAGVQTAVNSLPQVPQKTAAQKAFEMIGAQDPETAPEQPGQSEAQKALQAIGAKDPEAAQTQEPQDRQEGDWKEAFAGGFRQYLDNSIKQIKGKFRVGAAEDEVERKSALNDVFGSGNWDIDKKGNISVTLPGRKNPVKLTHDGLNDFADVFSYAYTNFLEKTPEMAGQLPKMLTQGATALGGAAAGFAMGGPAGAFVGGGAGNVAGSHAGAAAQRGFNQWLGQADPDYKEPDTTQKIGQILNQEDTSTASKVGQTGLALLNSDVGQFALGGAMGLAQASSAMKAAQKAAFELKGLTSAEQGAMASATSEQVANAKGISALTNFHNQVAPAIETDEAGKAGEQVMSAAYRIKEYHGAKVGLLDDAATQLQQTKGNLSPQKFLDTTKSQLQKYGIKFDNDGSVIDPRPLASAPEGTPLLRDLYTEAKSAADKGNGLTIDQTNQVLKKLKEAADYDKTSNMTRELFRDQRSQLTDDKISHMNMLFGGEDSPSATAFREATKEYATKKDAYDYLNATFRDPEQQRLMAKKLSQPGSPEANKLYNALEQFHGEDSPYMENIRSETIGRIFARATQGGKFNVNMMNSFLGNPDNEELLQNLFKGKDDVRGLKTIVNQTDQMINATKSTPLVKSVTQRLTKFAINHMSGGNSDIIMNMTGGNKYSVDAASESLISAYQKAIGQDQKDKIVEAITGLDKIKMNSEIVNIPFKTSDGTVKFFPKYVPMQRAAAQSVVNTGGSPQTAAGP